jgi:hypothetical protein
MFWRDAGDSKKMLIFDGTNRTTPLESTKVSKNKLKTNSNKPKTNSKNALQIGKRVKTK